MVPTTDHTDTTAKKKKKKKKKKKTHLLVLNSLLRHANGSLPEADVLVIATGRENHRHRHGGTRVVIE